MNYLSTRANTGGLLSKPEDNPTLSSAAAILTGLAADGGLFVPYAIPKADKDFLAALLPMSYQQRAAQILALYLDDFTADELAGCLAAAYGGDKFDNPAIAPVARVADYHLLELWHGPTSAFKDMALQLLPRLMRLALEKTGLGRDLLILTATSGDTGKAALAGFADVPRTKIAVFYPDGGVSQMQRLQMTTQPGANVKVIAVRGDFDDAQAGVKAIFADEALCARLAALNVQMTSANSINWGRLAPQIVYYFSAYADLVNAGVVALGDPVNFTVPTGNFGDIMAGFYARQMGLPVGHLVCASNANNVLTDFLRTGYYDRNRDFFRTISPSMDILVSSNLERLLYHLTGDPARIRFWMSGLAAEGRYDAGVGMLQRLQNYFWADCADDDTTRATIKRVYDECGCVLDPHTAVAWRVADEYRRRTRDDKPMVVVSTASPYKFSDSVLAALGEDVSGKGPFELLDLLADKSRVAPPAPLAQLRDAPVLHRDLCDREAMSAAVAEFARA